MTISLIGEDNQTIAAIEDLAARMLKRANIRAERMGRGANSRVFRLEDLADRRRYVVKFYFRHPADPRDRLETEFTGFSFLWTQGITSIPRPIAVNREESCAIYEFIEGEKISPENIAVEDIEYAVDFLARLKRLNTIARSYHLSSASEACFSIQAIVASIEERLSRLSKIKGKGQDYEQLESFLEGDFKPFLEILTPWARGRCAEKRISFDSEIPLEERTLSPSDFGFHNTIRARDGRIVFLDFEYFGWDDPAKTVVDFLLHPAMALSDSMKKAFVARMLNAFVENGQLAEKVKLVYPLFGLKWCTIFLNEFVPDDFSRRVYAAGSPLDKGPIRQEQLWKAKDLYRKIKETYTEFPYSS